MPAGRPRKEIKKDAFEKLCGLMCTEVEICGFFGVTDKTLNKWCKDTYKMNFSEVYKTVSTDGKISLRRMQFKLAEKSAAMAIFLGKNILGQSDFPETDNSDEIVQRANEQVMVLADQLKNAVPSRSIDELLARADSQSEGNGGESE